MDPATGLSVACNALQLFELAWGLVSGARAVYGSQDGSSITTKTLDAIANDVVKLSGSILDHDNCPRELDQICRLSGTVAGKLTDLLSTLKTKRPHSKWQSFRVALREIWTKEQAKEFASQIQQLQTQATSHIQYLIMNTQSGLYKEIQSLQKTTQDLGMRSQKDIEQVRQLVGDQISETQTKETEAKMQEVLKGLRQLTVQSSPEIDTLSIKLTALAESIYQLKSDMDITRSNQDTLQALRFESFDFRYRHIPNAYSETFEWAFCDQAPGVHGPVSLYFRDWLQNHDGIFWIRGKAGSGKSTLTKFLCNDKRTIEALQSWAGHDMKLVVAKYFLWNPGTHLQKSQEGLIRSLLFDILCQCPNHIPKIRDALKSSFGNITSHTEAWTREFLWPLLKKVLSENTTTKICLFLDGLDENEGDSESLIDTVKALADLSVKICVSSRPWAEFVHEFGIQSNRFLKVEDVTVEDIRRYSQQSLTSNSRFRRLVTKDASLAKLQDEIVSKSDGVFLWVNLVVRSLLQGLKYADKPSFLWKRLRSFPPDLGEFFLQMLRGIPEIYRSKAASTFKIAMAATPALPAMVYHFVDCVEEEENFALQCPWQEMPPEEITETIEDIGLRLDGWTKGLLEVVNHSSHDDDKVNYACARVEFLHRTVRDFMEESGHTQQLLGKMHNPRQDVSGMICHASLAFLKQQPENKPSNISSKFLSDMFDHAALVADDDWRVKHVHPVLNQVGHAMMGDAQWNEAVVVTLMCTHAAQHGLKDYLQEVLEGWDCSISSIHESGSDVETFYTMLLQTTLGPDPLPVVPIERPWAAIYRTVVYLVGIGANPNMPLRTITVWGMFLLLFGDRLHRREKFIIKICHALIGAGADLDILWRGSVFRNEIMLILPKTEAAELLASAPPSLTSA